MTTTIPTMTVRLDEVEGLVGWTAQLIPGTTTDPRPILTMADAEGTVQAARRVHGLEDAELEPIISRMPGTDTGTLVDLLVPIGLLDPVLREGAGIRATALTPRTSRRLAQRAMEMHTIRVIDAEETEWAAADMRPADADADADAWDF